MGREGGASFMNAFEALKEPVVKFAYDQCGVWMFK